MKTDKLPTFAGTKGDTKRDLSYTPDGDGIANEGWEGKRPGIITRDPTDV